MVVILQITNRNDEARVAADGEANRKCVDAHGVCTTERGNGVFWLGENCQRVLSSVSVNVSLLFVVARILTAKCWLSSNIVGQYKRKACHQSVRP